MRIASIIAVAIGITISASSAVFAADAESLADSGANAVSAERCMKDLMAFDEKLAKSGFGVLPAGAGYGSQTPRSYSTSDVAGTPRHKIRLLRDAAYVYAVSGDEKSCQSVLSSMRRIYL